jgi:hypothetical protein
VIFRLGMGRYFGTTFCKPLCYAFMIRTLLALLFFLHLLSDLDAQTLPKEGGLLSYRVIGFTCPAYPGAAACKLEIASGNHYKEESFRNNIIKTVSFKGNKIVAEVPSFGKTYTWRVTTTGRGAKKEKNEFHHFSTTKNLQVDTRNTRLRIIKKAERFSDAYVFSDGNKALYDMKGNPIWYLPESDTLFSKIAYVADLKVTPQNTITFIAAANIYEMNYNGDILWRGPANGTGKYHHEFTKLENSHYMVLGNRTKLCRLPIVPGENLPIIIEDTTKQDSDGYTRMPFGTVVEYDSHGNVIWRWESSKYFLGSDLVNYRPANGSAIIDLHENAFFFDQKDSVIYISFKNISRVVKIKYPEGTVMAEYGEKYKPAKQVNGNPLFCNQHACKYSSLGCLFLFNNNGCNKGNPPKVKKFKEPASPSENLQKVWEYDCTIEGDYPSEAPTGGNVIELPDHATFISMGGEYSKIFIVSDDKKILWSALPEQWFPDKKGWFSSVEYRASIVVNRKKLEDIIWSNERSR